MMEDVSQKFPGGPLAKEESGSIKLRQNKKKENKKPLSRCNSGDEVEMQIHPLKSKSKQSV